jgi:hypoxanthine phosphoribosyltransferase
MFDRWDMSLKRTEKAVSKSGELASLTASLETQKEQLVGILKLEQKIQKRVWDGSNYAKSTDGKDLDESYINDLTIELAKKIIADYENLNPVLVPLMDGALPFATKLFEELNKHNFQYQYSSMNPGSYGKGVKSGSLHIGSMTKIDLTARHVIIVDDLCDTGNTLKGIVERFSEECPISIETVVLLEKPAENKKYEAKYSGAWVPSDAWLIGMGMDLAGGLRNTSSVKAATKSLLATEEEQRILDSKDALQEEIKALTFKINQIESPIVAFGSSKHILHAIPTGKPSLGEAEIKFDDGHNTGVNPAI